MKGENREKKGFGIKDRIKERILVGIKAAPSDIKNARLITSGGFYASVLSW